MEGKKTMNACDVKGQTIYVGRIVSIHSHIHLGYQVIKFRQCLNKNGARASHQAHFPRGMRRLYCLLTTICTARDCFSDRKRECFSSDVENLSSGFINLQFFCHLVEIMKLNDVDTRQHSYHYQRSRCLKQSSSAFAL